MEAEAFPQIGERFGLAPSFALLRALADACAGSGDIAECVRYTNLAGPLAPDRLDAIALHMRHCC